MILLVALLMSSGFTTQGDILMCVACIATLDHVGAHSSEGHEWVGGSDMGKGYFDVFGLCYHKSL